MGNAKLNFTSDVPKRTTVGEYVMVMHLDDGVKLHAKTGTSEYSIAKDFAFDGILFAEEKFGKVLFWNWEGEETVIRTVNSAFPVKATKRGLLGKLSSFINADDLTKVESIRRNNARKVKFTAIKAKLDSFFSFEDDEIEKVYDIPVSEPKTLKEKLLHLFYEEVEETRM